jgi:adenosylmethionine-8-amino-7-oxononanoate aminotransferase
MFACSQEDVAPDFLCVAKGLTGGYLPLAATLTTDEVYNAFLGPADAGRTFYHGHTYTGNPLGAAAALASLDLLTAPTGLPALPAKVERLRAHLNRLRDLPIVGDVRQKGLMAGIELVKDKETRRPFSPAQRMGARACRLMREQGVLLRPLGDVVVVMPPLAIDVNLLDRLGEVLYNALNTLANG